jgi:hypothetical protein
MGALIKWEWTKRQSALRSIEASFHEITTSSSAEGHIIPDISLADS